MIETSHRTLQGMLITLVAIAALGGCTQPYSDTTGNGGAPRTTEGHGQNAKGALTITTAESDLGEIMVDEQGRTLYLFDNDTAGSKSACEGDCAATWPPVTSSDEPTGEEGIDAQLGLYTRADGSDQVTINGLPVYYFAEDEQPGDVNGQGVGGIWWVITPDGEKVTDADAPSRY
ncbi:hypothetical protein [Salinibacterium sp. ZJ450]|uniref:COG4315 family predicted lipoprotein n=1 Tax=Salinibacterium sp. ZJ450 TaxID=2708338 RepID=UPI0014205F87|nr:hypothetical protein [Salinibacterium sp. ZJ450]